MKITRRQLIKIISEAAHEEEVLTPEEAKESVLGLMRSGDLEYAEFLARTAGVELDLFAILASDYKALSVAFEDLVEEQALTDYLYQVADNSFYELGFFNAMLSTLPQHPSLAFGMTSDQIIKLINSDPEDYAVYGDAEQALGMSWSSFISGQNSSIRSEVKDWIIAIGFLKVEQMYNATRSTGESFSLSGAINSLDIQS